MMPEFELCCEGEEYTQDVITVAMYRRYTEIMELNEGESRADAIEANFRILKEVFGVSIRQLKKCNLIELLAAAKSVHFAMQSIVTPKFLELNPEEVEKVEQEKSAFDDYDEENGYNDEEIKQNENIWAVCRDNVDRVVKMCIRVMKNSYKQCMESDIMSLLDYVKFEIRTVGEDRKEV